MMNRPRPRKIINVIKTSPSTEIEEQVNEKLENEKMSQLTPKTPENSAPTSSNSSFNNVNPVPIIRKPTVATMKKVHVPPPPNFSDSPKSSPIQLTRSVAKTLDPIQVKPEPVSIKPVPDRTEAIQKLKSNSHPSTSSHNESQSLSPKSSGEAFLDAADKAADFIGGALINSFKSFNLTDTSNLKLSSPIQSNSKVEDNDNPFADIMKKLKSEKEAASSPNLMDEQPPESFKFDFETTRSMKTEDLKTEDNFEFCKEEKEPFVVYPKSDYISSESECCTISDADNSNSTTSVPAFDNNSNIDFIHNNPLTGPYDNESISIFSANQIDNVASPVTIPSSPNSIPSISALSSVEFFDSVSSIVTSNSNDSSLIRPVSPVRTGFRASILRHGLSALEKIGKSTADVVVGTRNKLSESSSDQNVITPNFNDESSSFYDILRLYGGYSKLQVHESKSNEIGNLVDYVVSGANNQQLMAEQGVNFKDFKVQALVPGRQSICFKHHGSPSEKVLDIDVTLVKSENYRAPGSSADLTSEASVTAEIERVNRRVKDDLTVLYHSLLTIKDREKGNQNTVKSILSLIKWFSIFQSFFVILIGFAHVYVLKTFFTNNSKTRV